MISVIKEQALRCSVEVCTSAVVVCDGYASSEVMVLIRMAEQQGNHDVDFDEFSKKLLKERTNLM